MYISVHKHTQQVKEAEAAEAGAQMAALAGENKELIHSLTLAAREWEERDAATAAEHAAVSAEVQKQLYMWIDVCMYVCICI